MPHRFPLCSRGSNLFVPRCLFVAVLCTATLFAGEPASSASPSELDVLRAEIARLKQTIADQQTDLKKLEDRLDNWQAAPVTQPQDTQTVTARANGDPSASNDSKPLDFSGYFSSRYSRIAGPVSSNYDQQTVSLFVDKNVGRLKFHSELEYEYGPDLTFFGKPEGPASGAFNAETAWLNYEYRDWLKAGAGIFLTPTYWSLHHYPSTALTVEDPLMYERIFPANIIGVMVQGSHYFERGGFDYSLYGGKAANFEQPEDVPQNGYGALGGTFVVHVPARPFLDALDAGVHLYRDQPSGGMRQRILGFQNRIAKGRFEFLGEMARARVRSLGDGTQLFRQGYYLQPSWRLTNQLNLYYRYDWLKFDSTDLVHPLAQQNTAGVNFRPIPQVSLKFEWNQLLSPGLFSGSGQGLGAGLALFFQ